MSARTPIRLAVIGHPIGHSLSPRMHRAALSTLGIEGTYDAIDVSDEEGLAVVVGALRSGALSGVNVTIPHKTAVIRHLDDLEPDAEAVGAVNTIVPVEGRLLGANTDVGGLARALSEAGVSLEGRAVVVLGAGGAARAAVAAARGGRASSITVAARDLTPARSLGPAVALADRAALAQVLARADVVVQASSATMTADAGAFVAQLPLEALPPHAVVMDVVYRPRQTALLAACAARGLRTLDGVGMLVHQGALSLSRWLALPIEDMPVAVMRSAVLAALIG